MKKAVSERMILSGTALFLRLYYHPRSMELSPEESGCSIHEPSSCHS